MVLSSLPCGGVYGTFCAIATILPVPGSTEAIAASRPLESSAGTASRTDCSAAFCFFGSRVVVISSPPRYSSACRSLRVSPNAGLLTMSLMT
ncbi:hypothetical protein ISCU110981_15475 [Isoptericola cucumis]